MTHFLKCKIFVAEATAEFPTPFACEIIKILQVFQEQFSDLDSKAEKVRLFQNPLEANVASCVDKIKLEVIELQANDLKDGLSSFISFYPRKTLLMSKLLESTLDRQYNYLQ